MKRKITALICALVMISNINALAAFSDVDTSSDVGNAVSQLSSLGIINGFSDGTFHPDETLTRAQFAKIAVHMLGEQGNAAARTANMVFSDVPKENWASGYINYIAEREIINGYPDGTFGANDTINYAQALTILIRLLGYDGEDVGYRWPDGYVSKADALGITKNMSFDKYESLTRANAAYLVYNTLLAEKKENSAIKLLSSSSVEDIVIYGDGEIDASLASGNIMTTKGAYKLANASNIKSSVYGRMGTLYLDGEGKATAFVPKKETVRTAIIVSAAKNTDSGKVEITFTENAATRTESFGINAPVYYGGKSATLENAASELETGREALLFFSEGGIFERIYLKESSLEGPITITGSYSQIYSSFNISNNSTLSVVRDGRKSTPESISMYDVVYYMRSNNTVYAYTDKITGIYEEAYPIKANVSSVLVAGREYQLSSQKAINKMNESSASFDIGERVTLLFGRNGEVIDVVDMSASGNLDIAVLTECYSEISTDANTNGKRTNYITLVLPQGDEVTYETDTDYKDYIGNVMRVSYSNGIARLSVVGHNQVCGEFDASVPSLDGHWLTSNCGILELTENIEGNRATVRKIDVKDIITTSLTKNQVIHAELTSGMKDISFLYVQNVTKADADFGVVTKRSGNRATVLIGEQQKTFTTNLAISNGSAVEVVNTADGERVTALSKVGAGTNVSGYSSGRIRVGSKTYAVSDYVKIYGGRTADDYHTMSIDEMLDTDNVTSVTLYSDRSLGSGGIVRVIVLKTKR